MADWKQLFAQVAGNVEEHFDTLKSRFQERIGSSDPLKILPYHGYGTAKKLFLSGRVIEDNGITASSDNDTLWQNLLNIYKRLESDEIPGARLRVSFQGQEQEVVTDEEGLFEVKLELTEPLRQDSADVDDYVDFRQAWHDVELELLEPQCSHHHEVRATGQVLVPPPSAKFGVISDIDDTVVQTDATNMLRMARVVFLNNARTRLPFEGVAGFYRALQQGASGQENNPIFYVSSSPWNLYDLFTEFFEFQGIPTGPILLRDLGLSRDIVLATGHESHKLSKIQPILNLYPELPFILIGDSGQQDAEIYRQVVHDYPGRILAVYIRNVTPEPKRQEAICALAEEVRSAGSQLLLAQDTLAAAMHAVEQGWISSEALQAVRIEKEVDEREPSLFEQIVVQQSDFDM